MEDVLFRFLIVWLSTHIILFFVEWYRYKHCELSWYQFKLYGMLDITYYVLGIDIIGYIAAIAGGLLYWILEPIIY